MTRILVLGLLVILVGCGGVRKTAEDGIQSMRNRFADQGSVCNDPSLIGEAIGNVPGNGACGIPDAIRLRAVDGVALSTPATIRCETAKALKYWVNNGARPAVGKRGGGLSELKVAASYACRTRNHQRGARLSEHSKGNAIDISAVRLADGSELSVLHDWRNATDGKILKSMHGAACGPFGTVLGPKSDRFHQDHFHFDVANHRGGPYCK